MNKPWLLIVMGWTVNSSIHVMKVLKNLVFQNVILCGHGVAADVVSWGEASKVYSHVSWIVLLSLWFSSDSLVEMLLKCITVLYRTEPRNPTFIVKEGPHITEKNSRKCSSFITVDWWRHLPNEHDEASIWVGCLALGAPWCRSRERSSKKREVPSTV